MAKIVLRNGKLAAVTSKGKALQFQFASDSNLILPVAAAQQFTSNFTFEMWVFPQQNESSRRRMGLIQTNSFILWIAETAAPAGQAGRLELYNYNGASGSGPVLPNNTWSHIAVSVDTTSAAGSANIKVYVNGDIQAISTLTTPFVANTSNTYIGAISSDGARRYRGMIADLRLWTATRTASQIAANFRTMGALTSTTGLVGRYLFNEASGSTATDSSPAANHGTFGASTARIGNTAPVTTSTFTAFQTN